MEMDGASEDSPSFPKAGWLDVYICSWREIIPRGKRGYVCDLASKGQQR